MKALLLLEDDVRRNNEIYDLFSNAGYHITWGDAPDALQTVNGDGEPHKSVTIVQVEHGRLAPSYVVSLARGVTSPWRLSLHRHCLVAPNAKYTKLTTLEFKLIKLFALVEKGEVVSRKSIVDDFGEHFLSYDQNRLDALVMRLRKKTMQRLETTLPLNTVRIRGFSFDDCLILDH